MSDATKAQGEPRNAQAPEAINRAQRDEATQAQRVAEEAREMKQSFASDKPAATDENDDAPDLVDRMRQMERSGRVDMDAYRGERSDDDEEGLLGPAGVEDRARRGRA